MSFDGTDLLDLIASLQIFYHNQLCHNQIEDVLYKM